MHAEFFFIVFTTKICFLLQNHNFSPIKTSTAAGPHSFNWSKNIQILELRTCEHDTLIETQTPGSWKYDENYFNQNYFNSTLCQHERSADKISLLTLFSLETLFVENFLWRCKSWAGRVRCMSSVAFAFMVPRCWASCLQTMFCNTLE